MILHACDPGLRLLALSEFRDGVLTCAHLLQNPEKVLRGAKAWDAMARHVYTLPNYVHEPDIFVFEKMKVYSKADKVDPADLVELTGVAAWCAALSGAEEVASYLAQEWKGQVPKRIHNERIKAALTPPERQLVENYNCPEGLRHNLWDSAGIGLFHLGRLSSATTRAGRRS